MSKPSETQPKMPSERYQAVVSISISTDLTLQHAVAQFEQQYIREILSLNQGHKAHTAQMLGINRKTLYTKLKKYALKHHEHDHKETVAMPRSSQPLNLSTSLLLASWHLGGSKQHISQRRTP